MSVVTLAPEPNYKRLYAALKKEHDRVLLERENLRDKVCQLSAMVLGDKVGSVVVRDEAELLDVPVHVATWMIEYNLPWQVFKCDAHNDWVTELDCCFPYHMEMSTCDKCRRSEL